MNIFGAFTFGSLIKTFIPGFAWLIALGVLATDIGFSDVWAFAAAHEQAALVLAIPASILLGLLSNIVVFMGLNDWLVRNPVKKRHPELFSLHESLTARFRDRCWHDLGLADAALRAKFNNHIDVEIMMLQLMDPGKLAYVREQYWYHLEFQINLFLSSVALFGALMFSSASSAGDCTAIVKSILIYGALILISYSLLIFAARRNFQRHISKISSLIAAAIASYEN